MKISIPSTKYNRDTMREKNNFDTNNITLGLSSDGRNPKEEWEYDSKLHDEVGRKVLLQITYSSQNKIHKLSGNLISH